jgi:hypothetical protein
MREAKEVSDTISISEWQLSFFYLSHKAVLSKTCKGLHYSKYKKCVLPFPRKENLFQQKVKYPDRLAIKCIKASICNKLLDSVFKLCSFSLRSQVERLLQTK